jgi:hypothetical protein
MRKVIILSLLVVLLFLVGCGITQEQTVDALAGQATREEINECFSDPVCQDFFQECYNNECALLEKRTAPWNECVDRCLESAQGGEIVEVVEEVDFVCTDSDDGRNVEDLGVTIGYEWASDPLVVVEYKDFCIEEGPKAGRLTEYYCDERSEMARSESIECGDRCEDGECIGGEVVEEEAEEECVPLTREDCLQQDRRGVFHCADIDDGCGGTVNCALSCPNQDVCENDVCVGGGFGRVDDGRYFIFVPLYRWAEEYNNRDLSHVDLTGDQICEDFGYDGCVSADLESDVTYYSSVDGSCDDEAQISDSSNVAIACDFEVTSSESECRTLEELAEPIVGDMIRSTRMHSVTCFN